MYAGIDLGSTNIKCAIYDEDLKLLARESLPVEYIRENGHIEFDALLYAKNVVAIIRKTVKSANVRELKAVSFTGQAETLIAVGKDGLPLRNAISWMDERSVEECEELSKIFPHEEVEATTGQMAVLSAWPATKILWLRHNEPDVYEKTETYMLLKDYVVYYLTGVKCADMSIATFSLYFDIYNKKYWKKMLDAIGITEEKLPPLVEPCTDAGYIKEGVARELSLSSPCLVNVGTLDHFAGMIGTGNLEPGSITLSTGTVMAMATMTGTPVPKSMGVAMHYGFLKDTYVMLPVAESGGVSLEWLKRTCMEGHSYDEMNHVLAERKPNNLLFLPYLVGTNAPEFDSDAVGCFYGLRQENDVFDMARAVMEGVSFVLRKNCEEIERKGFKPQSIIATGGGAKSPVWCQLQADITGLPVRIPKEKEAACLGASMIASVAGKSYGCLHCAAKQAVAFDREYLPDPTPELEAKFAKFNALYDAMIKIARM